MKRFKKGFVKLIQNHFERAFKFQKEFEAVEDCENYYVFVIYLGDEICNAWVLKKKYLESHLEAFCEQDYQVYAMSVVRKALENVKLLPL